MSSRASLSNFKFQKAKKSAAGIARAGLQIFVLLSAILVLTASVETRAATLPQTTTSSSLGTSASPGDTSPDVVLETKPAPARESIVLITVKVPHNLRPIDNFTAFPYPVKPPTITKPIKPFEMKEKGILSGLFSTGYTARMSPSRPYAQSGWRWTYAYWEALRKSKLGEPHTVIEAYGWTHEILPYMKVELKRTNAFEEQRSALYQKAVDLFDLSGTEMEGTATRNGLGPVDISLDGHYQSKIRLAAGQWWITGIHRVPSLVYYWQLPITVSAGEPLSVQLTESNALVIQGSW